VPPGVVAPLGAGGTIAFRPARADEDATPGSGDDPTRDYAVGDAPVARPTASAPAPRTISVRDVEF
jgi:hypothetical protein